MPYGNLTVAGALPIPASLQPSSVATAPNISYPDSLASGLLGLARGTKEYFGLRFTGERSAGHRHGWMPGWAGPCNRNGLQANSDASCHC